MSLDVAKEFEASISELTPLQGGNLHESYVATGKNRKIFLQRMNTHVFHSPEKLIDNYQILESCVKNNQDGSVIKLSVPKLVSSLKGETLVKDKSSRIWRAMEFMDNTVSYREPTPKRCYEAGFGLGVFHNVTQTINHQQLFDPLPTFHYTTEYLKSYDGVLKNVQTDKFSEEKNFIESFRARASILVDGLNNGRFPKKIIHGDPKLENFLFDSKTDAVVALVDLDTVKPGILLFDIGDAGRSMSNPLGEDAKTQACFEEDLCLSLLDGYLSEACYLLSDEEKKFIIESISIITFELGLRFFSDHLNGNKYFNVKDPEHNLRRARVQFQLLKDLERKKPSLEKRVKELVSAKA